MGWTKLVGTYFILTIKEYLCGQNNWSTELTYLTKLIVFKKILIELHRLRTNSMKSKVLNCLKLKTTVRQTDLICMIWNTNNTKKNWQMKPEPLTRYCQKRGWTASIGRLYKVQHSFFDWTLVLKIPAFGNTQNVSGHCERYQHNS